jgi:5-methylcytosine-specific restriction endonuclease McrA
MARNEILRLAGKIRNGNKKLRFEIFKRDGFKCAYCGRGPKDNVVLHVDHIHPKSKGGINSKSNLITACFDCNIGKSDALLSPV